MLNDQRIKALKPGNEIQEADRRNPGAGSLLLVRRAHSVAAYHQYYVDGKKRKHPIGHYKLTSASQGMTLRELRDEHARLGELRQQHPDLKTYFEHLELQKQEQERLAKLEASKGSFEDLLLAYIDDRTKAGMAENSIKDVLRFKRNDCDVHPDLMAMRACDVQPHHINAILTPILQREKYRQADKVRSYLHAAFAFGLKHDNIAGRAISGPTFAITQNPVSAITPSESDRKQARKAATRALSDAELAQFYKTCDLPGSGISWTMAQLFKMVIATGGQRIDQLCRIPWEGYQGDYIRIIDPKGRGSIAREHLVPHTERTKAILAEVAQVTGGHSHPFSRLADRPFHVSSYSSAIQGWLETDYALIDEQPVPSFTPRVLRRTMTQLMKRAGVSDHASNELQSHGISGVVKEHYDNDPETSLPNKVKTLEQVERSLRIILGEAQNNILTLRVIN